MTDTTAYKVDELKQHTTEKSCWLAIRGNVYDITPFLEEHPGGYDVILSSTGRDATEDYEEIGHSNSADKLLEKYLIGKFEGGAVPSKSKTKAAVSQAKPVSTVSRAVSVLLPIAILAAAVAINYYLSQSQ